ncbi:MAG: metallophosphoesterase [Phycisphaerae bacterium]|nr:metallophosphoesterase [Phycisphaerae bacterium]
MSERTSWPQVACLCCAVWLVTAPVTAQNAKIAPPRDLLKGAGWQFSVDGGQFSDELPLVAADKSARITARSDFNVPATRLFKLGDRLPYGSLTIRHDLPSPAITLNSGRVTGPLKGMFYNTIPGIDPKRIHTGKNRIMVSWVVGKSRRKDTKPRSVDVPIILLLALQEEHLAFQTHPIVGACGKNFFSVTCRTNMLAEASLTVTDANGKEFHMNSPSGLIHRFRVDGLTGGWRRYALRAGKGTYQIEMTARARRPGKGFRFVAAGDSRTCPDRWKKIAEGIARVGPELILFSGDLVADGRNDIQWDRDFFGPARGLLSRTPFYPVIGNHERDCPLFKEIFYTPSRDGRASNWTQSIGPVLLIGIDGRQDWSKDSKNVEWLEKQLKDAEAEFIFMLTHYPAWTSSGHGRLGKDGRPGELPIRQGQDVLMPLLKRYRATALIAGHDHCYERSEVENGVTMITTGGAGAPLYKKSKDARKQNPYSKVFYSKLHFCVFDVSEAGDLCTMRAIDMEGKVLDVRRWKGRSASLTSQPISE